MSTEPQEYVVTLPHSFGADSRTRGGLKVLKSTGYRGPLTKEQLKALKADPEFSVSKAGEAEAPDTTVVETEAKKILDDANSRAEAIVAEAEKTLTEANAQATAESEKIVTEAKASAEQIVEAAKKQAEAIVAEATKKTANAK